MAASLAVGNTDDFAWRSKCPVCDSGAYELLLSLPYAGAPLQPFLERHYEGLARLDRVEGQHYDLWRCKDCDLIYQPLVPAGELLQEIYDRWIPLHDPERPDHQPTVAEARARMAEIDFMVITLGRSPARVRYLDFGSGWGEALLVARAFGCQVTGCELSVERRRHAESLALPMLTLQEACSRRFDIVDLEQVLEHLVDPRGVLQTLAGLVEPGGILRVAVPDGRRVPQFLKRLGAGAPVDPAAMMAVHPLEHINCFTHASLVELGRRCGLTPITPSLRRLYDAYAGWASPRGGLANLLRPLYRHVWPRSPTVYFTRSPDPGTSG